MKNFLKNILRWANVLLILATLLAYLSPFINPAKVWHLSFLGLSYPLLLLGNVLFVMFWLWQKNKRFLFSLGCILVGAGYFSSLIGLSFFDGNTEQGDTISVASYNMAHLRRYYDYKGNVDRSKLDGFKSQLRNNVDPDILCIQEGAFNHTKQTVQNTLQFEYFFKEKGTIIFSKYPFADSGIIPFENTSNSCIWGDLQTPNGLVRVYSVHLQSNWLGPAAHRVAEDSDLRKKKTWTGIAQVMRLYRRAAARRASQAEMVAAHIAKSPHPVILCGDFNDTPISYVYHVLSENLTDSFCEKGVGFDFTYAGKIPGLRIDFVLTSEEFEVVDHQVPKLELSDHYPVLVKLKRMRE